MARSWLEGALSGSRPAGLAWAVMLGYLRLMTSRAVRLDPFAAEQAIARLRSWVAQPQVIVLEPGRRHIDFLRR